MHLHRLTSCFALLLLAFVVSNVSAQDTYYWNPAGSTTIQGGSATIDTTTPLWNTSSTPSDSLEAWNNDNHAIFAGTGGTITSNNASLTTGNVAFTSASYMIEGNLNLGITGNFIVREMGSLTLTDALTINADFALYNGTLNVNGGSFTTTAHGYIGVDGSSNGRLNISNGGSASMVNNSVGTLAGSYGFITVDGEGSTLTNHGDHFIGQTGYGQLTISNGADATANNAYLGYATGGRGYVTVTGAGSTWTITSDLFVGYQSQGTGSLTVADGGVVSVANGSHPLTIGANSTLRIGQDDGAAGTIQASVVSSTSSTGRVVFDHNEANYDFSTFLSISVGVDHIGSGTTTLSHTNDYIGGTTISSGTLRLGADQAIGGGPGDITMNGGTLDLNGHAQVSDLLYVTADSVIDFTGNSSLTLNNSHYFTWTGLLTILNFGAGDIFRVGTIGNGLTSEQLNRIIIGGFYAQMDASGYITASAISAVPEPSTYAMIFGLGALTFAAWRRSKASRIT